MRSNLRAWLFGQNVSREVFYQRAWESMEGQLPLTKKTRRLTNILGALLLFPIALMSLGAGVLFAILAFDLRMFLIGIISPAFIFIGLYLFKHVFQLLLSKEVLTITPTDVHYRRSWPLAHSSWVEPIANYKGVAAQFHRGRGFGPSGWEIFLLHEDRQKTIPMSTIIFKMFRHVEEMRRAEVAAELQRLSHLLGVKIDEDLPSS